MAPQNHLHTEQNVKATLRFLSGMRQMPFYAQAWVALLMLVNMVIPLFYLHRLEAQVALATFMLSAMLMMALTGIAGFSRLLGLGHFLWFPLLIFLWLRLPTDGPEVFRTWIYSLILCNSISLTIDVVDVIRYISGDREEMYKTQ